MRAVFNFAYFLFVCLWSAASFAAPPPAPGQPGQPANKLPAQLEGVGIEEQLGKQIPVSELVFRNEAGKDVRLAEYFSSGKPVLLTFVYYGCPNLCNFLLNGLSDAIKPMDWLPGDKYEIVSVSIEPSEGAELASAKKAAYIQALGRPGAEKGWHFLTGTEENIRRLAAEAGFKYKWDEAGKQWAHTAGVFVLTPGGKVSRVLHGIMFKERDLRLGLLEASSGKIGTLLDKIVLFCFHYNPQARGYTPYVFRIMQAAALCTVLIFGSFLAIFWARQRKGALSPC